MYDIIDEAEIAIYEIKSKLPLQLYVWFIYADSANIWSHKLYR